MTTLRWGVLGAASIARRQVIPAIQASATGRVVAIASRERARAEELARSARIDNVFDDYQSLLNSADVDAVYIPLPNSEHHRWTIAAAQAGKHILCEKPLALNAAEAQEMVDAAANAGVLLAEAFMYRHHPLVSKVLELINSGAIGDLRLIRATFTFAMDRDHDIRLDPALGGGALMDVGCYGINLARLVTNAEPTGVVASAAIGRSDVDETFAGVLRFNNDTGDDMLAVVDASLRAAGGPGYEIIGSAGKIVVRQGFKIAADEEGELQLHQAGDISRIFTDAVDQYQLMVDDFGKAVIGTRPFPYPPEDAVANMRVIDMAREATRRA
jgi:D-xylose 1-dehydrogenase (NADP+, D-xylono-1,5-lactone-forming)